MLLYRFNYLKSLDDKGKDIIHNLFGYRECIEFGKILSDQSPYQRKFMNKYRGYILRGKVFRDNEYLISNPVKMATILDSNLSMYRIKTTLVFLAMYKIITIDTKDLLS